jgi:hypothetical protein
MTVVYVFNIYCKTPLHAVMCLPTQFRGYVPKILEANAYALFSLLSRTLMSASFEEDWHFDFS